MQLLFLIGDAYLIGVWLGEDKQQNKQIAQKRMFKRDHIMSPNIINYSTLNSEQD